MELTSIRYQLTGKELGGHEGASADIHLFRNGRINGELLFGSLRLSFNQSPIGDLDVVADILRRIADGTDEELIKILGRK